MRNFKIITLGVGGKGNKIFKSGQIVSETDLHQHQIQRRIDKGDICEVPPPSREITGKLRVAIVSAVWKRPEVFEMFAKGIQHLIKNSSIEFEVIIAGSEWDKSKTMVEKYGFTYIEIPNEPLAAKVNATTYACRNLNVDYVLCVGSDDVIHPDLMKEYEKHMRQGIDFIGVTDFYFFDTVSGKSAYWGGYRETSRKDHTCGAGRIISSRLLKLWDWMPWENKDSTVLDNSMQQKLKNTLHTIKIFSLKETGTYGLDIKSSTNMTPFKLWDNTEFINTQIIKEKFSYVWD